MGLFGGGEKCCICGKKAGLLTRQKLGDRQFICGDCRDLCSQEITPDIFESIGRDSVSAAMDDHRQRCEMYNTQFRPNMILRQNGIGGHEVLAVDEANGWWANPHRLHPEVFAFNEITGYELRIRTEGASPDNPPTRVQPQRSDFPACPPDQRITSMDLLIGINHPVIQFVSLPVMDALIPVEGDVIDGYALSERICAYLDKVMYQMRQMEEEAKEDARAKRQADVLAAAVSAAAGNAKPAASAAPAQDLASAAESLKKLKELVDMGILTQEEFDAKKKQLLGL